MKAFAIFPGLIVLGAAANAAETITYTYDARGASCPPPRPAAA